MKKKTNPWHYAEKEQRDYITPEDIGDAFDAGGKRFDIWRVVLHAIDKRQCEDVSLCAFVAHKRREKKKQ
jgi:hypothetical protein